MFNYGFFPQTWEDPDVIPPDTKCPGDNDPIDCVEVSETQTP
jgi:inorganic pyrophosphatase